MSTERKTRMMRGRPWLVLLTVALFAWLVPQRAAATHVDDTWNYSVSLNGSNTVAIKVPVYDEDGADCWVVDGKLKMKVDGVETTLFRWQSETDIDNDDDDLDCWFQTWADGYITITQGNSSSHFVLYSSDGEQKRTIYANSDGETYDVTAVWRVPHNLRGKTITFTWDVTRDGNSRSKEGVSGLGSSDLSIPAAANTVYPQVTEATLSYSEVGKVEIPWFIATDKLTKIWAEYDNADGSYSYKELETNMSSGYVPLDATVPHKNFHIVANYTDPDGDAVNGVSSTTQDLKMLHVPVGFKATPLGDSIGQVQLTWSIEYPEEEDLFSVDNFEIQRSLTGEEADFMSIGAISYSSKNEVRTYTFTDNTLLGAISEAQLLGGGTLENLTYRVRRTATQTWGWDGNPAASTASCLMDDLHLLRVSEYSAAWEDSTAFTVRVKWKYAHEYNAVWDDRAEMKIRVIQTNQDGLVVDSTVYVLSEQERNQRFKILDLSRTCVNYNIEVFTDRGTSPLRLYDEITSYYFPIRTAADWQTFRDMVKEAKGQEDVNARLYADISTNIGIGWETSYPYRGTFDGNGHTVTFNLNSSDSHLAPFRYVSTATIKNLNVAGSITSSAKFTAGLIGNVMNNGTTFVENCRVSATLTNNINGDASMGGFVGVVTSGSNLYLRNCLFDGGLEGSNCHSNGGFVGWSGAKVHAHIEGCLFTPSSIGTKPDNCATWSRGTAPIVQNSYASRAFVGKTVIIGGKNYHVLYNTSDWNEFVTLVSYGGDMCAILANDIAVTDKWVAPYTGSTTGAWTGTLDGNGHTLNLSMTGTGSNYAYNSPFAMASGCTIKNLRVTGTIGSAAVNSSGLAGLTLSNGSPNTISNCHISATISTNANYLSGLIGNVGDNAVNNITNCLFDGKLWTYASSESWASAFVYGTSTGTNVITNCLENGTYRGFTHAGFAYSGKKAYANNASNTNNWSYHNWSEMNGNEVGSRSAETMVQTLGEGDWHIEDGKVVPILHTQELLGYMPEDLLARLGDSWVEVDGKTIPKQTSFSDPKDINGMEMMTINGKTYQVLRNNYDWKRFREMVEAAKGETEVNAIMMQDLSITERVGTTTDAPFYGTFNGNGHTLTVNIVTNLGISAIAPFSYVKASTFRNLHVKGTVKGENLASGLVGRVTDTSGTTIRHCWVSVDVQSNSSSSLKMAGFVGYSGKSPMDMQHNRFDGTITGNGRTTNGTVAGAFIGWSDSGEWTFNNNYENGTYQSVVDQHMCFYSGNAFGGASGSGTNNFSAHNWPVMPDNHRNVSESMAANYLKWDLLNGKAVPKMERIADEKVPSFYHSGTGKIDAKLVPTTRQSSVVLTWTTDGKPIDYFTVYRRVKGTSSWTLVETDIDKNSYEDTTVSPLEDYQYKVVATSDCEGKHTSETNIVDGACKHTGMLEGYVRFNDGTGIAGLTISIVREDTNEEEATAVTDETGHYVAEDLSYHNMQSISYKVVPVTEGGRMDLDPSSRIASFNNESNHSILNELTVTNGLEFSAYVMYEGTSIPVKGAHFRVNGQLMHNNRNGFVETDFEGNASFMVLGGVNNVIQVEMDGHKFTGGGYYKSADGVVLTDKVSQTYFYDSTLVKVTGRVVGGNDQGLLPLDNNLSRNNLGSNLRMVLTLEGDNSSWLVFDNTNPTLSKRTLTFNHPAGKGHFTQADVERKRMVVRPDSVTGEYVLMLPPVRWKVTQVYCDGYPTLFQDGMVSEVIDLTNCLVEDTIKNEGTYVDVDKRTVYQPKETYNYRYNRIYHAPVEITYRQVGYDTFDYFGDRIYNAQTLGGESVDVPLVYQSISGYTEGVIGYKEGITGYDKIPIGIGEGENKPIFDAYTHTPKLTGQAAVPGLGIDRYEQLFDGDVTTQWSVFPKNYNVLHAWVNFKTDKPVSVTALNLTTGDENNIYDGRNPRYFRLLGRLTEDQEWTTLLYVDDPKMEAYSCKTYSYDVPDHSFYQYFRLDSIGPGTGNISNSYDYYELALCELSLTCRGKEDTEPVMTYREDPIYGQVPVMGKIPVTNGSPRYTFGYPVFSLERRYPIELSVVERYPWNGIKGSIVEDIVHVGGGKVTVHNGLKDGLQRDSVKLDSIGQGIYYLRAGQTTRLLTGKDALRTVSFTLEQDGTTYEAEPLRGYVLNMFATTGAKEVLAQGNPMLIDILRDPPGGGSSATLSKGSKLKLNYTVDMKFQAGVTLQLKTGVALSSYTGATTLPGAENGTITNTTTTNQIDLDIIFSGAGKKAYSYTMNVGEDITTSSAAAMVGADADVYIGVVQNVIATQMSTIRAIPDAMYRQMLERVGGGSIKGVESNFGSLVEIAVGRDANDSLYHLVRDVSLGYGPEVTSQFVHSQKYIVTDLLPRLAQEIRDLLFTGTRDEAVALANKTQKAVYWSKVAANHEDFGAEYEMISPDGMTGLRNEVDEKYSHFLTWMNMIASNEQEKLAAYDLMANYDVDGGSKVSYSESFESEFSQSQYIHFPFTTADYFETDGQSAADRTAAAFGALLSQPALQNAINALAKIINNRKKADKTLEARFEFIGQTWSFGAKPVVEYSSTGTYGTQNNYSRKESFNLVMAGKSNLSVDVYRVRTMATDTTTTASLNDLDVYHNANFDNWVEIVKNHVKDGISYQGIDYSKAIYPRSFVYRTRGGATCNPWEDARYTVAFRPGTLLDERTKKISNPKITLDRQSVSGVAMGDPARFKVYMTNDSEQPELVGGGLLTNNLYVDETTNPHGAKLYIDSSPLNGDGLTFFLKPGEVVEKTLEVYAGEEFDYEGLKIALCSPDDWIHAYDEVAFDVHYLREAGPVSISNPGDKWVMNTNAQYNEKRGWFLPITIDGFNKYQKNFDHIEFQYKETQLGDNGWTNLCSFYADSTLMAQASGVREMIPENGNIKTQFYGEGTVMEKGYDLRAVLFCRDGNSFLTTSSKVLSGVKDTRRPQLFGTPEPKDGILGLNDNIIFNFSEDIEHNYLNAITNFEVKGEVNNQNVAETVSVQFSGNSSVESEAQRNFSGKDVTIDMMIRPDETGRDMPLFSHGTNGKKLQLWLTSDYKLKAIVDEQEFVSDTAIVKGGFTQVALSIDQQNKKLTFYNGGKTIGSGTLAEAYNGTGALIFGRTNENDRAMSQYYEGRMMEARVWYRAMTGAQVGTQYGSRRLTGYEMGLVDYYPMNEGTGDYATDQTQGANAKLIDAGWAMPRGWSMHVDWDDKGIALNENALSRAADEDYTLMFWFKTDTDGRGVLLSNGAGRRDEVGAKNIFNIAFEAEKLMYRTNGQAYNLGSSYSDNQWHHYAMTVSRSFNVANIYVDQVLKASFPTDTLGGISSGHPMIGAAKYDMLESDGQVATIDTRNWLRGNIDEILMFGQALPLTLIKRYATKSPIGDEAGLMTYLAFDRQERQKDNDIELVAYPWSKKLYVDNNGDIRYELDKETQLPTTTPVRDYVFVGSADEILQHITDETAAPIAPSEDLKNLTFSFVGKDNQVLVNINEASSRINHRNIYVTLRDVEDKNGNTMASPQTACYYVTSSSLQWLTNRLSRTVAYGEGEMLYFGVNNNSATKHTYTIENCPKWLTLDSYSDVVSAQDLATITATVNKALNVGSYDEIIYLTDEDGVTEPLYLNLTVEGEQPEWASSVSGDLLQHSMNIVGRVLVHDEIDVDPRDIVGVFAQDGLCHGFANISYSALTGESNLYLTVYDNQVSGRALTFKLWQYSTGRELVLTPPSTITFQNGAVLGTDEPVLLKAGSEYVQTFDLAAGWNWVSFNVASEKLFNLNNLLDGLPWKEGDVLTDMNSDATLIYRNGHWLVSGGTNVTSLSQKNAYAIMVHEDTKFPIAGNIIKQLDMRTIELKSGWNGIGYTPMLNLPIETALSDYYDKAQAGDVIKSHDEFAYFTVSGGVGRWKGSLEYMKPGEGYMLLRKATTNTRFTYPFYEPNSTFIDEWSYSGTTRAAAPVRAKATMSVSAVVEGVEVEEGDKLVAYANGERVGESRLLSGSSAETAGPLYLSIGGDKQQGIWFAIERDGDIIAATSEQMTFTANAVVGSPDEPTAIRFVQTDREDDKWYSVSGIQLPKRPTVSGVYIFNGKKIVIK